MSGLDSLQELGGGVHKSSLSHFNDHSLWGPCDLPAITPSPLQAHFLLFPEHKSLFLFLNYRTLILISRLLESVPSAWNSCPQAFMASSFVNHSGLSSEGPATSS